jgi:hypothetical protein
MAYRLFLKGAICPGFAEFGTGGPYFEGSPHELPLNDPAWLSPEFPRCRSSSLEWANPQDAPKRQEPDSRILLHILVFVNGCFSPLGPNEKSNLLEFAFMPLSIWGGGGGGGCEEDDDEDDEEP